MREILITGGSGFIGKNLFNLLKSEYSVYLTGHLNILNTTDLEDCFGAIKPDTVIHLAAQSLLRESIKNPVKDATVNIIGSINILDMCVKYGVKKIIYPATAGAKYGNHTSPVDEGTHPKPISPYGISKHTVEHYLEFYKANYGLDYVSLCFGNVFGEYDNPLNNRIITTIINNILNDSVINVNGDGSQIRDYIYVQDLCRIIREFLTINNKHTTYNLGTGVSSSIKDIISIVEYISKKTAKVEYKPFITGELKDVVLDCERFTKELKFTFTNFVPAIEATYRYYENINIR